MFVKAIQTRYAGCHFRSRLEARWARFFDALGINWEYEPQGYEVGIYEPKTRYLPDFYLPATQTWVEVKGSEENFDYNLLADAVDWGMGLPGLEESYGTDRGLLLLGPIPRPSFGVPLHPLLQHRKGGVLTFGWFTPDGFTAAPPHTYREGYFDSSVGAQMHEPWVGTLTEWFAGTRSLNRTSIDDRVLDAYTAARSARFEYGARG